MPNTPHDLDDRIFWTAKENEIKRAETTDIYFEYAVQALKGDNFNPRVLMEVYTRTIPYEDNWGVVAGIYEATKLLEDLPVDVNAMEEGEVFLTSRNSPVYEPVMQVEADYQDIAAYENPLLGLICTATSVATKAARIKKIAGGRDVISFGSRRVHPSIAPTIERAAYIGGCDGVSNVLAAKMMKIDASGTMPHALVLCYGDQKLAWKAFDKAIAPNVPRIVLVDTLSDEKTESIEAYETLGGKLNGVRLDTPASRRGDIRKIVEEVRWELGIRGASSVKIFVSGGLDEAEVEELKDVVDGFGVGTHLSAPPPIDFNLKIVEVFSNGKMIPRAKRGDLGGKKQVYRDTEKLEDIVTLATRGQEGKTTLLKPIMENGKIVRKFKSLDEIRSDLMVKMDKIREHKPQLKW